MNRQSIFMTTIMIYHNRHLLVLNTVVDNSNHVFEIYYVRVLTVYYESDVNTALCEVGTK